MKVQLLVPHLTPKRQFVIMRCSDVTNSSRRLAVAGSSRVLAAQGSQGDHHETSRTTAKTSSSRTISTTGTSHRVGSSRDLVNLMLERPDLFMLTKPDEAGLVATAILSGFVAVGSVTVIFLTGPAMGATAALVYGTLSSVGITALTESTSGLINGNFSWHSFTSEVLISAGVTMLTFGAGFGTGRYLGLALKTFSTLSAVQIKAVASIAGAVVGAAVKDVCYVIKCDGIDPIAFVLEGLSGALIGGMAAYLAVNQLKIVDICGRRLEYHSYDRPMAASDVERCLSGIPDESNTLILTGTHGDRAGTSVVEALYKRASDWLEYYMGRARDGIADGLRFFRQDQCLLAQRIAQGMQGGEVVSAFDLAMGESTCVEEFVAELARIVTARKATNLIFAFCYSNRGELVRHLSKMCNATLMFSKAHPVINGTAVGIAVLNGFEQNC